MPSVTERTARKCHPCGCYPCQRNIEPGERYRRSVAFPGDEGHEEGTRPWVIKVCPSCVADEDAMQAGNAVSANAAQRLGDRVFRAMAGAR